MPPRVGGQTDRRLIGARAGRGTCSVPGQALRLGLLAIFGSKPRGEASHRRPRAGLTEHRRSCCLRITGILLPPVTDVRQRYEPVCDRPQRLTGPVRTRLAGKEPRKFRMSEEHLSEARRRLMDFAVRAVSAARTASAATSATAARAAATANAAAAKAKAAAAAATAGRAAAAAATAGRAVASMTTDGQAIAVTTDGQAAGRACDA